MERRSFLRAAAVGAGAGAVGATLTRSAVAAPVPARSVITGSVGGYGPLGAADENGIELPPGFRSRVIARSGERVSGTGHIWHDAPVGGGVLADGAGWIHVCDSAAGGAGSISFDATGTITGARRIRNGTQESAAGCLTPWGTWLSGERTPLGLIHECDPRRSHATARPALGRFRHSAAAADAVRGVIYLAEDADQGCLYRFVPARQADLRAGRLEVLTAAEPGGFRWADVADPSGGRAPTRSQVDGAITFNGAAGLHHADDLLWVGTRGDNQVWRLDLAESTYAPAYDPMSSAVSLAGVNGLTRGARGELFIVEGGGHMRICTLGPDDQLSVFLRVTGQGSSSLAGPAFAPGGDRLYFSSRQGPASTGAAGVTYEISGPFRR